MGTIKIDYPKEKPPKGKKWLWRPCYWMTIGSLNGSHFEFNCAFCGKKYENEKAKAVHEKVGWKCECGAIFVKPEGMCGLIDKNDNHEEVWI